MSRLALLLRWLAVVLAIAATGASRALASATQESLFEDDAHMLADPAGTLRTLRELGVQRIRLAVRWQMIAPNPGSRRRPRRFVGYDPASYPRRNWRIWDEIVRLAARDGIGLDFDLSGGAPLWATGPGAPRNKPYPNWEPSAREFGKFARAVGARYSGAYKPLGATSPLPQVRFWSIWNEPDYGPSLAPQGVPGDLTAENSPRVYRNLLDAAWTALRQTGHGGDTILFGEVAPRGESYWGVFSGMKPLTFLRALYCVDSRYRPLRGAAAALRDCPTAAPVSRRFRADNPALFLATGFADHPYMRWYPPNREAQPDPNYSSLGQIANLERALDRLQRVYGSPTRLPIYDTEFGYITSPPKHETKRAPSVSPSTAAYYLNWAEYIHWRNPRLRSFAQYLLYDPEPALPSNNWGGFASGLLTYGGREKATYDPWRLPLYLPVTSTSRGQGLEVWGCVRPAHFAILDAGRPQTARIQFRRGAQGSFTTIQAVTIASSDDCYFDIRVTFPSSGEVRLAWVYPTAPATPGYIDPIQGQTVYSRGVGVTVS